MERKSVLLDFMRGGYHIISEYFKWSLHMALLISQRRMVEFMGNITFLGVEGSGKTMLKWHLLMSEFSLILLNNVFFKWSNKFFNHTIRTLFSILYKMTKIFNSPFLISAREGLIAIYYMKLDLHCCRPINI